MARNPLPSYIPLSRTETNTANSTRSNSPSTRSELDWVDVLAPHEIGLPTHNSTNMNSGFNSLSPGLGPEGISAARRRGGGLGVGLSAREQEGEREMIEDDSGKGAKEERPSGIGMESRFPPEPLPVRQTRDKAGRFGALNDITPRTFVRHSFSLVLPSTHLRHG